MPQYEQGFYWVIYDVYWSIARYDGKDKWYMVGDEKDRKTSDFEKIGDYLGTEPLVKKRERIILASHDFPHLHQVAQFLQNKGMDVVEMKDLEILQKPTPFPLINHQIETIGVINDPNFTPNNRFGRRNKNKNRKR